MKMPLKTVLLAILFTACSFAVKAQSYSAPPLPPHYRHFVPVSWVVATRNNMDDDDRFVTLIGQVTRRIGDHEYWFSDGTGRVRLDAGDAHLPIGPRIMIGGRIDQAYLGFGNLEVDVRRWQFVHPPYHP